MWPEPFGAKKNPPLVSSREKHFLHQRTPFNRQVSLCINSQTAADPLSEHLLTFIAAGCILWYVSLDLGLSTLLDMKNWPGTPANPEKQYTLGPDGKRIYTLKKVVDGKVSKSA